VNDKSKVFAVEDGNAMKMLGRIGCWLRRQHATEPMRTVNRGHSAFTCARCGANLRDFDEAGFGSGYVDPLRRLYERKNGIITRTGSWDADPGIR
jgi:hypothetical protein